MALASSTPAVNAPARPAARAPRNGKNMPPAHALDPKSSSAMTTTSRLVRATGFDDVQEPREPALIVDEEALHLREDRFVVVAGERPADPRLRAVELAQHVGQVRRGID